MNEAQQIDTGDTVFHVLSGETWVVACVEDDHLSWVGWPEGRANLADCQLIKKASDEEKHKLLVELANMNSPNDHRARYARYVLNQ